MTKRKRDSDGSLSGPSPRDQILLGAEVERSLMQSLANRFVANPPEDFLDVLQLSHEISPSPLLKTGGVLFESYIHRHGGETVMSKLKNSDKTPLTEDFQRNVLRKYGFPFWFHVIRTIKVFNQKASKTLFHWTMMLEFRGLSRYGRFLQAVCHIGMDVRTYDRWKKKELSLYNKTLKNIMEGASITTFLYCLDNYNRYFGNPRVDVERDTMPNLLNLGVLGLSVTQPEFCPFFAPVPLNPPVPMPPGITAAPCVPNSKEDLRRFIDDVIVDSVQSFNDIFR